ncbi:hypothetical protein QEH59_09110 [Coraliomargarita sp. SDUM461004]|uniref:Uncharacterized protein n=1 Tax=Thalassobacterium sedimentorum TaxID=3041258 RepID=A0ABU1AK81_9BACT|nr:hypothetical protein [Coraliomargarita sp. SDUM461004]MDQ8194583.1 hypothetical protein [Coraliomargarita sp. SDUM461004]
MNIRVPILLCCTLALSVSIVDASSRSRSAGFGSRRANNVEDQRVKKQMWAQPQANSMMDKSFPIEQWDKHFSPVGSKRAGIALTEDKDKQMFQTKTLDRKQVDYDMSRWNDRMADLHQKAGIEMDDRASLVADRKLYYMMLQDSEEFRDMAEELSLRDLNRYQFRRNRSDSDIPVEKAGGG